MMFVMCALALLFVGNSDSAPPNICRVTGKIRVSCPADYQCCGNDECCKLTFGNEEETVLGDVTEMQKDLHKIEPVLILARLLIITILVCLGYFLSRYFKCKALTPDVRKFTVPGLPRYKHLDKDTVTGFNVSTLSGSPYNETSTTNMRNGTQS